MEQKEFKDIIKGFTVLCGILLICYILCLIFYK